MTPLGRFLRKLRIDHDEILYDMAQKLRVSSSFLSSVENGRKSPPPEWLDQITSLYGLTPDEHNALMVAMNETISQVRLNLHDQPIEKRDMAIAFARRFDAMSNEEVAAIMSMLNKRNKE